MSAVSNNGLRPVAIFPILHQPLLLFFYPFLKLKKPWKTKRQRQRLVAIFCIALLLIKDKENYSSGLRPVAIDFILHQIHHLWYLCDLFVTFLQYLSFFVADVTVLLSLTVFLNQVSDSMPNTSDAVPLISMK